MQSADSDLVALLFPVGVDDEKSLDEHFRTVIPPEELQRSGYIMSIPVNDNEKIFESRVLAISSLSAKAPVFEQKQQKEAEVFRLQQQLKSQELQQQMTRDALIAALRR